VKDLEKLHQLKKEKYRIKEIQMQFKKKKTKINCNSNAREKWED